MKTIVVMMMIFGIILAYASIIASSEILETFSLELETLSSLNSKQILRKLIQWSERIDPQNLATLMDTFSMLKVSDE